MINNVMKQIKNANELINSKRCKRVTNNKIFSDGEIVEIDKLFTHIQKLGKFQSSYKTFTTLVTYDTNNLINRFDYLLANSSRRTHKTYIMRYGEDEGEIRWTNYVDKQRKKNLFESKKEKYGWTIEQFDEFNKSRSMTLDNCILRHGEGKGHEMWHEYLYKQKYSNSREYYMEKYGDEGEQKWLEYNKEKGKSSSIDFIMEKNGVDYNTALKILSSRYTTSHSSKAELAFVDMIEDELGRNIKYSAKTHQYCIWNKYTYSPKFYDLVDPVNMKIIEFHGDYWHCNPARYPANFVIKQNNKMAREIWQEDYHKTKAALDRGFEVKIVWWSDFESNATQIIEESAKWLDTKHQQ